MNTRKVALYFAAFVLAEALTLLILWGFNIESDSASFLIGFILGVFCVLGMGKFIVAREK